MIRNYLRRNYKIFQGAVNSYLRRKGENYDVTKWWDEYFYRDGVSDKRTISWTTNAVVARYHYVSVELIILRYLFNSNVSIDTLTVLDIGSGAGHWIDFYRSLGAIKTFGIDVSQSSVEFLKNRYLDQDDVMIRSGRVLDFLENENHYFDLVNAIGVMFHIVDDAEWSDTINGIAKSLPNNGIFIASGQFGLLDGLNVQIDTRGQINKRLRSKKNWIRELRRAGFSKIQLYKNNAYLWLNRALPESNVLIAVK